MASFAISQRRESRFLGLKHSTEEEQRKQKVSSRQANVHCLQNVICHQNECPTAIIVSHCHWPEIHGYQTPI